MIGLRDNGSPIGEDYVPLPVHRAGCDGSGAGDCSSVSDLRYLDPPGGAVSLLLCWRCYRRAAETFAPGTVLPWTGARPRTTDRRLMLGPVSR